MAEVDRREKIVALREMLRERFPGSGAGAGAGLWTTGLPELDSCFGGGLPRGAITEVVAGAPACGGQWLLAGLLRGAVANRHPFALVDRSDAWDPGAVAPGLLDRFLWVRCREAGQAMRAGDILVRDGNIAVIVMDMRTPPGSRADRIPAQNWYRLQRNAERSRCVLVVVNLHPAVPGTRLRVALDRSFRLEHLEWRRSELAGALKSESRTRGPAATQREVAV